MLYTSLHSYNQSSRAFVPFFHLLRLFLFHLKKKVSRNLKNLRWKWISEKMIMTMQLCSIFQASRLCVCVCVRRRRILEYMEHTDIDQGCGTRKNILKTQQHSPPDQITPDKNIHEKTKHHMRQDNRRQDKTKQM